MPRSAVGNVLDYPVETRLYQGEVRDHIMRISFLLMLVLSTAVMAEDRGCDFMSYQAWNESELAEVR
jgi:hypothetical protein